MATALHGSQVGLLINGCDMASYFYEFAIEQNQAMHDATTFGNSSRLKVAGLKDGKLSGSAFHDATADVGSYAILKGLFTGAAPGTANPGIFSYAPIGFALGNPVTLAYAQEVQLNPKVIVDDLVKLMMSADATEDGIDHAKSLHAIGAETSFPFLGTGLDNAASTANGGVAVAHVTAIAGADPNIVIAIQHSANGTDWVDLVIFTAVTAANSSRRSEVAAGVTVNRHLRMTYLDGGTTTSVTAQASFARR